jgi:hypothetical protein
MDTARVSALFRLPPFKQHFYRGIFHFCRTEVPKPGLRVIFVAGDGAWIGSHRHFAPVPVEPGRMPHYLRKYPGSNMVFDSAPTRTSVFRFF